MTSGGFHMPCISGTFNADVGILLLVAILPSGTAKVAQGAQGVHGLVDTGATRTCVSPQLANDIGLVPHGKSSMRGVTGTKSVNSYHVDFILGFGSSNVVVSNLVVSEFNIMGAPFDVLIGRDVICQGVLTMDHSGHFSFSI